MNKKEVREKVHAALKIIGAPVSYTLVFEDGHDRLVVQDALDAALVALTPRETAAMTSLRERAARGEFRIMDRIQMRDGATLLEATWRHLPPSSAPAPAAGEARRQTCNCEIESDDGGKVLTLEVGDLDVDGDEEVAVYVCRWVDSDAARLNRRAIDETAAPVATWLNLTGAGAQRLAEVLRDALLQALMVAAAAEREATDARMGTQARRAYDGVARVLAIARAVEERGQTPGDAHRTTPRGCARLPEAYSSRGDHTSTSCAARTPSHRGVGAVHPYIRSRWRQ
ncbi:MAG: hypothetical protein ACTHU0_21895 [Kofleriaceae bacterium]